jgi:hypothetical protein
LGIKDQVSLTFPFVNNKQKGFANVSFWDFLLKFVLKRYLCSRIRFFDFKKDRSMNALEFSTQIEQGLIRLPKQFEKYQNAFVRIIVLVEPEPPRTQRERLLRVFEKMNHLKMFESIENPLTWQKKLRDEWE